MDATLKLHLANDRIREAHQLAAAERLAASHRRPVPPPQGPLATLGHARDAVMAAVSRMRLAGS